MPIVIRNVNQITPSRHKLLGQALNDPMRGVDLGAKRDLYDGLAALALAGIGILFLSTELAELCLLCDRVVVFHDHSLAATLDAAALDERSLIAAMFGEAERGAVGAPA